MKSLIVLMFCSMISAPALALDLSLKAPQEASELKLSPQPEDWHLRLTQKERTQYMNILEKEKQRFWLGYGLGIGAGFFANGMLSLPLLFSIIPLSVSGIMGPGPVFFNMLTIGSLYSMSAALVQTITTQWLMNQSQHFQFKLLPAFLANLLGQGLTTALFIGLASNSMGIFVDPVVAWQDAFNSGTELAFGSLSVLGAAAAVFVAHYTIAPLFGSWVMMKTATVRPGFRIVEPAPEKKLGFAPASPNPYQTSLLSFQF